MNYTLAMKSNFNKSQHKIRVLILLSRMNVGGPSSHVVHLAKGLNKKYNFETRLAVGKPAEIEGSMIDLANSEGVTPHIISGLNRAISPFNDFKAFIGIIKHIYKFKPHIVHTHTAKAGILGRLAALICRVPVIIHTFHGHVFEGYFSKKTSLAIICFERLLARFTDKIITLTPGLKYDLINKFRLKSKSKVSVIPLGFDFSKFTRIKRKSTNWRSTIKVSQQAILMGIVARLVPVKNHCAFLEVFKKIVERNNSVHLAIIGGGESEQEIRHKIESLGLQNKVHLTGIVEKIEHVYSDLDLLILPSRNEGTPFVIIEAIASGCPVAATDVGGVKELLHNEQFGILLPTDHTEMANKIINLLNEYKHLPKTTKEQQHLFANKYSITQLLKNITTEYFKLLQKRGIV